MSLKTVGSKIKTGAKELTSVSGLKHMALNLGAGVAIGAIVALVIRALFVYVLNPVLGTNNKIDVGFSIYPNQAAQVLYYEDILLIATTVGLFLTKKLWFVVGYFLGWYSSNYLGLWTALGLPVAPTEPTQ